MSAKQAFTAVDDVVVSISTSVAIGDLHKQCDRLGLMAECYRAAWDEYCRFEQTVEEQDPSLGVMLRERMQLLSGLEVPEVEDADPFPFSPPSQPQPAGNPSRPRQVHVMPYSILPDDTHPEKRVDGMDIALVLMFVLTAYIVLGLWPWR